jgi:hypothetical protein
MPYLPAIAASPRSSLEIGALLTGELLKRRRGLVDPFRWRPPRRAIEDRRDRSISRRDASGGRRSPTEHLERPAQVSRRTPRLASAGFLIAHGAALMQEGPRNGPGRCFE